MEKLYCYIFVLVVTSCGFNSKIIKEPSSVNIEWEGSLLFERTKGLDGTGSFILYKIHIENNTVDTVVFFIKNPYYRIATPLGMRFVGALCINYIKQDNKIDSLYLASDWELNKLDFILIKPGESINHYAHDLTQINFIAQNQKIKSKDIFEKGIMHYIPVLESELKDRFPPHYKLLDSLMIIPKSKNYRYGFDLLDEFADNDWFSGFNMELSFIARFEYNVKRKIKFESEKRLKDSLPHYH